MSSAQMSNEHATQVPSAGTVDTTLKVVIIPVSDVDRAKRCPGRTAKLAKLLYCMSQYYRI
jgi:hypothetical protein